MLSARRYAFVCLLLLCATSLAQARPKIDTVWTDQGDRVICEILELTQGQLRVSTNDMGTFTIDWLHVSALHSRYFYRIEPREGGRFFGSLWLDSGSTTLVVHTESDRLSFSTWDVVEILPIEKGFWSRMDGALSLGFSYTKASEVAQLTFNWSNRYTMENDMVDLKASTIATSKGDTSEVSRNEDFSAAYYRLFGRKLNASVSAAFQRNDELGLKRRTIGTITGGVSPIRTNLHTLLLSVGVALNSELGTSDTSDTRQSGEGVFKANYSLFKYDSPKSNLDVIAAYYPSFTEEGRHRLDFNLNLSHELVSDFFLNLSYYTNLDSKPPTQDASKSDYGVVTSVSYTY